MLDLKRTILEANAVYIKNKILGYDLPGKLSGPQVKHRTPDQEVVSSNSVLGEVCFSLPHKP